MQAYFGKITLTSYSSLLKYLGNEPTTSANPPVFIYGTASEEANKIFHDTSLSVSQREKKTNFYLAKSKKVYQNLDEKERSECLMALKKFVRFYEFLLQVSLFNDTQLHKKYKFICWLIPYLNDGNSGKGFDLSDKIKAFDFHQSKGKEIVKSVINSKPNVKLPVTDKFNLTEDEEKKLSEIIKDVNSKTGKSFDNDVATKAALQIKDLMMKNEELKAIAKNNTVEDFAFAYYDNIDDALLSGRNQNKDFFDLLLKNTEIRNDILGVFKDEIYNMLRKADEEI